MTETRATQPARRLLQRIRPQHSPIAMIWLGFFVVFLTLYVCTANRQVDWLDSGWQQYRIVGGELNHPRGLALCHPLQYYLCRFALRILNGIEPAWAMTLVSSLFGAVAVANIGVLVYLLCDRTTRHSADLFGSPRTSPKKLRVFIAIISALAFGLCHTFWQHATHTESYTIVAALLSAEWICLALYSMRPYAWLLVILALLNGLGVANHLLAGFATPVDVVIILWAIVTRRASVRVGLLCAMVWLLGSLPYSILVMSEGLHSGDWDATIRSAIFGKYTTNVLNTKMTKTATVLFFAYFIYNFPGLTIPLGMIGVSSRRFAPSWLWWALTVELGCYLLFVVRYAIVDQYTFYFPVYALLCVFAGVGLAHVVHRVHRFRRLLISMSFFTAIWQPLVYISVTEVISRTNWLERRVSAKPYRDPFRAFFIPWGIGESYAVELNRAIERLVHDGDLVILADHLSGFGVRYWLALGRLPEIQLHELTVRPTDEELDDLREILKERYAAGDTVVLVPRNRDRPNLLIDEAEWERVGDIYVLRRFTPQPASTQP